MTFSDIALNDEFKEDGIVYTKLSESQARGPKWHWRKSELYEFSPDDPVEEFSRWRMP